MLENDINPIEGYVIERFHSLIFNNMPLGKPRSFKANHFFKLNFGNK
jgi:hypothetical protein